MNWKEHYTKQPLKVGDTVTIRRDLEKSLRAPSVVQNMLQFRGQTFIIKYIGSNTDIDLENNGWTWGEWMFEKRNI